MEEVFLNTKYVNVPYLGTSQAEKEEVLAWERRVESPGKACHARQHAPEATTDKADV